MLASERAPDLATDLAIGLVLVVGVACWTGLVAGQLGVFGPLPVVLAAAATLLACAAAAAWRSPARSDDGPDAATSVRTRVRKLDGPAVFLIAAALYSPGYDATLYGSDATAYFATGAQLARSGALTIDAPLLERLAPRLRNSLFPLYRGHGEVRARSPAGLAFSQRSNGPVYSSFSQLPAVWLAIGFAVAGLAGALTMTPLLAAGGVMAFYLTVRRTAGVGTALLAAGLLASSMPQIFYARFSMGAAGVQFFTWGALLAVSRWYETRERVPELAVGIGFGLCALTRPEYLVFLPLLVVLAWLLPGRHGPIPLAALALAVIGCTHALWLLTVVFPSHYSGVPLESAFAVGRRITTDLHPGAALAALGLTGIIGWAAWRRGRSVLACVAGVAATLGLVAWAAVYAYLADLPAGTGLVWLPAYTGWPVLVMAAAGVPLVVRAKLSDPSARIALLLCMVAAAHFLYDPHVTPMAGWGARRFVPLVLPLLFACAAGAVKAAARFGRPLALALAVIALGSNLLPTRHVWGHPFLRGTSAAAAEVAALIPANAVVLIDPSLQPALLDVALWLVHQREAVQMPGAAMTTAPLAEFVDTLPERPMFTLRQAILPAPSAPGLSFNAVGDALSFRIMRPGVEARDRPGVPAYTLLTVRAYRAARATPREARAAP